jgi:hypothetical protein
MSEDSSKHLPDMWFKIDISGDQWSMYLVEDDDEVIANKESGAETDWDSKEIHFRRSELTPNVVRHELYHAYAGYCYLEDTSISVADAEEVAACLFADRASLILKKSDEVYKTLYELRELDR